MEFRDLINSSPLEVRKQPEEARFSFLKGGYVEDFELQGTCPSFLIPLLVEFKLLLFLFQKRIATLFVLSKEKCHKYIDVSFPYDHSHLCN